MITQEQKDKKIAAATRRVEELQQTYDGRLEAARRARTEAERLVNLAESKETGAEAAKAELAYAQADLEHRKAAPVAPPKPPKAPAEPTFSTRD